MTNEHRPKFKHSPEGVTYAASCVAPECPYVMYAGGKDDEWYTRLFTRDHASQYEPGRAPNIEVEYVISALCSVCEDGVGDIVDNDGESVRCEVCRTTWYVDGTGGERR